ncbi:hypothetical protein Syun_004557 [Stephania yunnanensis]|uniref:Uncharacterized protein n=1 Tax=Stephania yunnanensis TaxID=152371 RepID=A0AAP0L476_9MAGN
MRVGVFMLLLLGFGAFPFWRVVFFLSGLSSGSNQLFSPIKYALQALMYFYFVSSL